MLLMLSANNGGGGGDTTYNIKTINIAIGSSVTVVMLCGVSITIAFTVRRCRR